MKPLPLTALDTITNIMSKVINVIAIIAPVVNAIVLFMLPFLVPMGDALRSFIVTVLELITVGNYTWFIVVAAVTLVASITLVFLFPGYKDEKE